MYHAVASVGRVGFENAVGGRVVARRVHGIRARLVEGGGKPDISSAPAGDGDVGHGCCPLVSSAVVLGEGE